MPKEPIAGAGTSTESYRDRNQHRDGDGMKRAPGEPKFGANKDGRAPNNGQQRTTGGTDRAQNSGQPSAMKGRAPGDWWGSEENMKVPTTDKDADWYCSEDEEY